jgi:hypothetical protein
MMTDLEIESLEWAIHVAQRELRRLDANPPPRERPADVAYRAATRDALNAILSRLPPARVGKGRSKPRKPA